jgi:D-glycero-D-manno-heptose 1,7-bisphosphate phosphatase
MAKKNKAVFLDRDGVINEAVSRDGGYYSPRQFSDFKLKEGVKEFVAHIKKLGFLAIVVTNQPDVARGLMAREELDKMHDFMRKELSLDDVMICPHDNSDDCRCRKPKPGMLIDAADKWQIDLKNSWVIGDTKRDTDAGKNAGVRTILIDALYNRDFRDPNVEADYRTRSWSEIIEIIK